MTQLAKNEPEAHANFDIGKELEKIESFHHISRSFLGMTPDVCLCYRREKNSFLQWLKDRWWNFVKNSPWNVFLANNKVSRMKFLMFISDFVSSSLISNRKTQQNKILEVEKTKLFNWIYHFEMTLKTNVSQSPIKRAHNLYKHEQFLVFDASWRLLVEKIKLEIVSGWRKKHIRNKSFSLRQTSNLNLNYKHSRFGDVSEMYFSEDFICLLKFSSRKSMQHNNPSAKLSEDFIALFKKL